MLGRDVSRLLRFALLIGIVVVGSVKGAFAQAQPTAAQVAPAQSLPPIPEGDVNALIKQTGITESDKTVKELIPGWKPPKSMVVAIDRPDRLAWLQEAVPGVKLVGVYQKGTRAQNVAEALPYAANADAFIHVSPNVLCIEDLIKADKQLKWIHSFGAGPDDCLSVSPELASGKLLYTDSAKLHTQVPDMAIALAVSLMQSIDLFVRMDMSEQMKRPKFGERGGWEIEGRTILVVGLGGIGTQVAKMSHGLGMHVIATRETSHQGPDFVDYVGLSNELPNLIGKADLVVITLPLTPQTKGLFNSAMFARMKRGAILINVGRGEIVVQPDLVSALKSGQVGGAGLEVTDPEPLPDHDPLFSAPNTIIMPHGGAPTMPSEDDVSFTEKVWLITREEMRRYAAGEKMLNVVDVSKGY